jgi:hypothetical protein
MRPAIALLSGFAFLWWSMAVAMMQWSPALLGVGMLVSGTLLISTRGLAERGGALEPGFVRRTVMLWSGVEVLGIVAAVKLLQRLHLFAAIAPVITVLVGLHFLPLARSLRVRAYYFTALVLVLTGAAALLAPDHNRPAIAGVASALALWGTAVYLRFGTLATLR